MIILPFPITEEVAKLEENVCFGNNVIIDNNCEIGIYSCSENMSQLVTKG